MKLSVILISWNSLHMLRRCLLSLHPVMAQPSIEIIWVDNGSTDGTADFVHTHYPSVRTILLNENCGVARARNHGIRNAKGEYILLLDDDTEASAEAINTLIAHLDSHPLTAIAGCALRSPQGELQDSFKPFPGLIRKIKNVIHSKLKLNQKPTPLPDTIIHPTYIIGACQMIRRKTLNSIGLLDEKIFYGPEDADICLRARHAGWSIDYLPSVSIIHHWRRITSRSLTSPASRRHIRALLYFWRKHKRFL